MFCGAQRFTFGLFCRAAHCNHSLYPFTVTTHCKHSRELIDVRWSPKIHFRTFLCRAAHFFEELLNSNVTFGNLGKFSLTGILVRYSTEVWVMGWALKCLFNPFSPGKYVSHLHDFQRLKQFWMKSEHRACAIIIFRGFKEGVQIYGQINSAIKMQCWAY